MSRTPLVSVVTPAFNCGRFIDETIDSVLAQTHRDWEMIIVDDCSRDDTLERVKARAAGDSRIRWARSPANEGAGPARNRAIALARGRFLAFLDGDDLWAPSKLEHQLAFMASRRAAFSFTAYSVVSATGSPLGRVESIPETLSYVQLLKRNPIGCLTVMLDRERVVVPPFEPMRTNQDFALWLKILRSGTLAHGLPVNLASYRIVGGSNTRNKLKSARNVWKVYRQQGLAAHDLIWLYAHYVVNGTLKHLVSGAARANVWRGREGVNDVGTVRSADSQGSASRPAA